MARASVPRTSVFRRRGLANGTPWAAALATISAARAWSRPWSLRVCSMVAAAGRALVARAGSAHASAERSCASVAERSSDAWSDPAVTGEGGGSVVRARAASRGSWTSRAEAGRVWGSGSGASSATSCASSSAQGSASGPGHGADSAWGHGSGSGSGLATGSGLRAAASAASSARRPANGSVGGSTTIASPSPARMPSMPSADTRPGRASISTHGRWKKPATPPTRPVRWQVISASGPSSARMRGSRVSTSGPRYTRVPVSRSAAAGASFMR